MLMFFIITVMFISETGQLCTQHCGYWWHQAISNYGATPMHFQLFKGQMFALHWQIQMKFDTLCNDIYKCLLHVKIFLYEYHILMPNHFYVISCVHVMIFNLSISLWYWCCWWHCIYQSIFVTHLICFGEILIFQSGMFLSMMRDYWWYYSCIYYTGIDWMLKLMIYL